MSRYVMVRLRREVAGGLLVLLKESSQQGGNAEAVIAFQAALRKPTRKVRGRLFKAARKMPSSVLVAPTPLQRRASKREETASIYEAVAKRADGYCECGCGRWFQGEGPNKPELDHQASRRVPQTTWNTWMLAKFCHELRQSGNPDTRYWLEKYIRHCRRHIIHAGDEYAAEARRAGARLDGIVALREIDQARRKVGL